MASESWSRFLGYIVQVDMTKAYGDPIMRVSASEIKLAAVLESGTPSVPEIPVN